MDRLEAQSNRSSRSQSTDSSKRSNGGGTSLLELMQLRSAKKKSLTESESNLQRKADEGRDLWETAGLAKLAQLLANAIFKRFGKVPQEVEDIGRKHYRSGENAKWIENVIQDFEYRDVGSIVKMFTGLRTVNTNSVCKLLANISGIREGNPAVVLQSYTLWDRDVGHEMNLPTEYLDRAIRQSDPSSAEEAKLAVNIFVVGVVVNLLQRLDAQKYEGYFNYENVEDRSVHEEKVSEALETLRDLISASARKKTPVTNKVARRKQNNNRAKEFTQPRMFASEDSQQVQGVVSQSSEEALQKVNDSSILQELQASMQILMQEQKQLKDSLKKKDAMIEDQGVKIEELTQKLGAAQGFAKAVEANSSKCEGKKTKSKKIESINEDESEEQLSAIGSDSTTSSDVDSRRVKRSSSSMISNSEREVLIAQHADTVQITSARRPVDVAFLLDQIDNPKGLLWADIRGNLYAIRKISRRDSCTSMYKLSLLHANWQDESALQYDVGSNMRYFLPQNLMQWRAFINLQLTTLEKDMQNPASVKAAKLKGGYDTANRKECLNSYYLIMKDLIQSFMPGDNGSGHTQHVQAWAIVAHFHYLIFTYAMLNNRDELLRSNALSLWNLHFDAKIKTVAFSISFKDAATLLGYGCSKSGCRRAGVLDNYCPGCNRDEVRGLMGHKGSVVDKTGESFDDRYAKWKAGQEAKGVTDSNLKSKAAFKKANPAPKKDAKAGSKIVSEDEYFAYMGENQHLFAIQAPSRIYLNF